MIEYSYMAGELREKCAVAGVVNSGEFENASALTYEELFALQHRGVEASGMAAVAATGSLELRRAPGLVRDVYTKEHIQRLSGSTALGWNRYSTSGSKFKHNQPVVDEALGLGLAHNGNLTNLTRLDRFLERHNLLHGDVNDSEKMGLAIAQNMRNGCDLADAVEEAYQYFTGAFSCAAVQDNVMVAFRDPCGIRPLALGKSEDGWAVSSETCGLDIIEADYVREVEPGELVIITKDGIESRQIAEPNPRLDIFELVYFARHDSRLYGESVNEIRYRFGQQLAVEHPLTHDDVDNVLVVPVPDTSVPEAEGYAASLGLAQRQAIIKNRYIARTFIQPDNALRQRQLHRKHNIVHKTVKNKDLVIIDDSIVRLNTMPIIVEAARAAGAKTISVLIGSPPVRHSDFYGIDTPDQKELAAANMTIEQMRQAIGCEYLGFLSLQGMIKATGIPANKFNLSCFTGEYPIDIGDNKKKIYAPINMEGVE